MPHHKPEEWKAYSIFYRKDHEERNDDFLDLVDDFMEIQKDLAKKEKELEKTKKELDELKNVENKAYIDYCLKDLGSMLEEPKESIGKTKKYYYKVLPYAEYIDSIIPWFSKKWDSLRNDYDGLKAIAELAKKILEQNAKPDK